MIFLTVKVFVTFLLNMWYTSSLESVSSACSAEQPFTSWGQLSSKENLDLHCMENCGKFQSFVASSRPVRLILKTQRQKCKTDTKLKTVPPISFREGNIICNRDINYMKIPSIVNIEYCKTPLSMVRVLSKQCFIHWVMLVISLGGFTV